MEEISSARFDAATAAFFSIHAQDPEHPRAERYHQTLARWVETLPESAGPITEALRLAARCQHLRRWEIPRASYPMDRVGYKRWRASLTAFHVEQASAMLASAGYDEATIGRVAELLQKKRFRSDPEAGRLEDAVCLTFLELDAAAFLEQHPPEKARTVVLKTWDKMSETAQSEARSFVARLQEGPMRTVLLAWLSGEAAAV